MKSQLFLTPLGLGASAFIVTAALATGALTSYGILQQHQPTVKESVAGVSDDPPITINTVAAIGYLEPKGEVIQVSAPAFAEGARVDQLLVEQGDRVKTGQVIAILDSRDRLQAALEQAKTQVQVAQARLNQVKAGAKQGAIEAQSATVERLKAELEGQMTAQKASIARLQAQLTGEQQAQKATIERLKAQLTGERQAQNATIERLKAQLNNAETDCRRFEMLYQEGAVSASQRDDQCLEEETVRKQVHEAEANLIRIITTQNSQINEAQANLIRIVSTLSEQIQEAQANLNRTIITLQKQRAEALATRSEIAEVRPVDVEVAAAELATAKAAVQQAQANLDVAYVRSPRSGQVLKIQTWPGELVSNNGIVEIGQTEQMYVNAEVYETDIKNVNPGQTVKILSDGVVGELQGIVDEVGLQIGTKDVLGTDPVADADARVVEVKIRLNSEDSQRVAGLTNLQVNVLIDTASKISDLSQ
ncbi:MAG: biotin/lipoyl-binding protein [Moorea sp. SIO2I5]|nr:biotin/lipoyl-binding protein [Moorena sp. SIO2I5]